MKLAILATHNREYHGYLEEFGKMIEHHEHIGLLEFIGYHFVLAYDLECVCVKVEAIKIYGHFYNIMGNMMINQGFAG